MSIVDAAIIVLSFLDIATLSHRFGDRPGMLCAIIAAVIWTLVLMMRVYLYLQKRKKERLIRELRNYLRMAGQGPVARQIWAEMQSLDPGSDEQLPG